MTDTSCLPYPRTITRDALVEAAQPATGGTKTHLRAVLDALILEMTQALRRGDTLHIRGFGRFEVSETAERLGRNPRTGEPCVIPAGRRVKFRPSEGLFGGGRP